MRISGLFVLVIGAIVLMGYPELAKLLKKDSS